MKTKAEQIPHLRVCVTEKCGRDCIYCRPGGEACGITNKPEMSLRQIYQLVLILAKHGIHHLKITGGEPMNRPDIPQMISALKSIRGIETIEMVTRSHKTGEVARQLKNSGLSVINFSLDSLDDRVFRRITGNHDLNRLLHAIELCHNEGLKLKFNMVVMRDINVDEVSSMIDFAGKYKATLKLLDLMDMSGNPEFMREYYQPLDGIAASLSSKALSQRTTVPPGGCGTPMPEFVMPNNATVLVKDAMVGTCYGDVCVNCQHFPCQDAIMALRLNSTGQLQRCLLRNDNLVDLLGLVETLNDDKEIESAVEAVIRTFRHAVFYEKAWKP